jgi:Acetyltransferases
MLKAFDRNDFNEYLAMSREFYQSEATDHQVPETHFRDTFEAIVSASPLARGWLIIGPDGQSAGYLLVSLTWSNEFGGKIAWIEELYLKAETRGQGLGRRVIEAALAELREKEKVRGFRLEVAPANESVSLLYQKMGFSPVPYRQWWMAV